MFDQTDMGALNWTNLQYVVTATSASSVLQFNFQNDQNAFALDDISVTPLDALSGPTLVIPVHVNGAVQLTWSTVPSLQYQVQYATSLQSPNWTNLGQAINGDGTVAVISDPVDTSQAARFYRVVQQ